MFENVLADLVSISGVKGVYLVDLEGNLIEYDSGMEIDAEICAAFIAETFNRASELAGKILSDSVDILVLEGRGDRIMISKAGGILLGIISELRTNYGLMKIEMKKAVDKIQMVV